MTRRHLSLIVVSLLTFAISACADATGPEPKQGCPVVNGSGTRCDPN